LIKDDIFYGNLKGLLKTGKWTLSLTEASALLQVYQECERRLNPPLVKPIEEPIKNPSKKKKSTEADDGNK
jgi:hypothetical protein